MAIHNEIRYAALGMFSLDRLNPRLGRGVLNGAEQLSEPQVLDRMKDWALEELAVSFLESGFWPQEALVVIEGGPPRRLTVVEGNRRLAALRLLEQAYDGKPASQRWLQIANSASAPNDLFARIPYIVADSRDDIRAFLGYRHVTGIKEWNPAEKAQYIAGLVDSHLSYDEVAKQIGSKKPTVRQNYIAYRLLLQMEDDSEISIQNVEEKFSVLYLSLRTEGVQRYLRLDPKAEPTDARRPVPGARSRQLRHFAAWLFGTNSSLPLVPESRRVDDFAAILKSAEAVSYLERNPRPSFEFAFRLAGGDENNVINFVATAADSVEEALRTAHRYKRSKKLRSEARRLLTAAQSLDAMLAAPDGDRRE